MLNKDVNCEHVHVAYRDGTVISSVQFLSHFTSVTAFTPTTDCSVHSPE